MKAEERTDGGEAVEAAVEVGHSGGPRVGRSGGAWVAPRYSRAAVRQRRAWEGTEGVPPVGEDVQ